MKSKFTFISTVSVLLVFVLGACSTVNQATNDLLEGTSWKLTSYGGTAVLEGTTVTANFADGEMNGSGGCNSYGGSYQVNGNKIQMENLMMTLMACLNPEGVMDQEAAVFGFLQNAETFEINAEGQLLIYNAHGEALTFVPAE